MLAMPCCPFSEPLNQAFPHCPKCRHLLIVVQRYDSLFIYLQIVAVLPSQRRQQSVPCKVAGLLNEGTSSLASQDTDWNCSHRLVIPGRVEKPLPNPVENKLFDFNPSMSVLQRVLAAPKDKPNPPLVAMLL